MKIECPRCHTRIEKPVTGNPVCPTCGFGGPSTGAAGAASSGSAGPGAYGGASSGGTGATSGAGASAASSGSQWESGWDTGSTAATQGNPSGPYGTAASSEPGGMGQAGAWGGAPAQPPRQGMAITALVLGIVGCCLQPIGLLAAIPAAIVGGIAMNKSKKNPQQYGGYGMALTGLILGILGTIIGLVILIFYTALFIALFQGGIPQECLEDPESAACEQALEEQQNEPSSVVSASFLAPVLAFASGRRIVPHAYAG